MQSGKGVARLRPFSGSTLSVSKNLIIFALCIDSREKSLYLEIFHGPLVADMRGKKRLRYFWGWCSFRRWPGDRTA